MNHNVGSYVNGRGYVYVDHHGQMYYVRDWDSVWGVMDDNVKNDPYFQRYQTRKHEAKVRRQEKINEKKLEKQRLKDEAKRQLIELGVQETLSKDEIIQQLLQKIQNP